MNIAHPGSCVCFVFLSMSCVFGVGRISAIVPWVKSDVKEDLCCVQHFSPRISALSSGGELK